MNDAQKLLDLFCRLHWALETGVSPFYGYGRRAEDIAAGKMPTGDVFKGRHSLIYSNALNLRAAHKVERDGRSQVTVSVGRHIRGNWEVELSCAARGQISPDEAAHFSDALAHAVKVAKVCEEMIARPFGYDIRAARDELDAAIRDAWEAVGKDGDPEEALAGALERLNA